MEVVASGMAVASLSLQLVDSVKRIRTFLRHVKDAPKELERLIDLLARLSTQLQEVHDICDQQASGQGPGLQPRSNTISQQLQSCKNTIQPLQELVEKYSKPGSGGPGFSKLMREIKLGAKAKSILELEERLEREMGYLQNAVVYSMAAMVKNTHPIMMQIHAVVTANSQVSSTHATTASATVSVTTDADPGIPCRTRSSRRVREVQRMPSLLEPFGVQRHKIIYRYRTDPQRQSKRSLHDTNEFILEHDEVSFVWTRFGYRISWDQSRSWTNILPSLRFCPVVEQFDDDLYDLIASGDIWEIQQFFAFGKIHPSTRNSFGQSLLHVSAGYNRADVCHLLLDYGVQPDRDSYGRTVLDKAIQSLAPSHLPNHTDTLRALMCSKEVMELSDQSVGQYIPRWGHSDWCPEPFEWLWKQLVYLDIDGDLARLQCAVFQYALHSFGASILYNPNVRAPKFEVSSRMRDEITSVGSAFLLFHLFCFLDCSYSSFVLGDAIIKFLLEHGIDVEAYLGPGVSDCNSWFKRRHVVLERDGQQSWRLGFDYVFDPQQPGYLVVNEFSTLTGPDNWDWGSWYSDETRPHLKRGEWLEHKRIMDCRFERRMASKKRKELARTGQKRVRSRMPGAWI